MNTQTKSIKTRTKLQARTGRVASPEFTLWLCALALVIVSAISTKERGSLPGLAQIEARIETVSTIAEPATVVDQASITTTEITAELPVPTLEEQAPELDTSVRWFDGKMARPSRVIYMTVTGYSPDARSCGKFADNKTATMYSVWTNGMNLVAADPKVLPYWSMVSIPGYANDDIVPVLDCGGAIKGNRIDLLYPTHKIARQWGVRQVPVTVWEFVEEE